MAGEGDIATDLRLLSPLGISVILFLLVGVLFLVIGVLTPFMLKAEGGLAVTERTDSAYFGGSPNDLLAADPALGKLRDILMTWISGCFVAMGMMFLAVTWFGLREGRAWSLATLAIAVVSAVVLWAISLLPYPRAGVRFTLGDLPPFIWVPAVAVLPATILGWIGIR